MKIHWQEFELDSVLRYFTDGFKDRTDEHIVMAEWFVDVLKGKVVFKIYTDENKTGK